MTAPALPRVELNELEAKLVVALLTRATMQLALDRPDAGGYGPALLRDTLPVVDGIIAEALTLLGLEGLEQLATRISIAAGGPG